VGSSGSELAFEFKSADGSYLGRTSQLEGEGIQLGGLKTQETMSIVDTGDEEVAVMQHDTSQWIAMNWQVQVNMPELNGFANTVSAPLSDPRIVVIFAALRFRGTGVFSPAISCILLVLLVIGLIFGIRRFRRWRREREGPGWFFDDYVGGSYNEPERGGLLNNACCSGNRGKH